MQKGHNTKICIFYRAHISLSLFACFEVRYICAISVRQLLARRYSHKIANFQHLGHKHWYNKTVRVHYVTWNIYLFFTVLFCLCQQWDLSAFICHLASVAAEAVPVKQPWRIWNICCTHPQNCDNMTTSKIFFTYHVHISWDIWWLQY